MVKDMFSAPSHFPGFYSDGFLKKTEASGAHLAQSVVQATLDLGVVSSSPILGIEFT